MNGFALFAGDTYYADGGWNDFQGVFPTAADAEEEGRRLIDEDEDWFQVVDLATEKVLMQVGYIQA